MPTHSKKEEPKRKPKKIIKKKDKEKKEEKPKPKPKKIIKKKMKVPTITITEAPKKIKKKPKATPPVPPLEKKKFRIRLPKEEKPKSKLEKVSVSDLQADKDMEAYRGGSYLYIDPKTQLVYENEEDFKTETYVGELVSMFRGRGKKKRKGIMLEDLRGNRNFFAKDMAYGYDYGYIPEDDIQNFYTSIKRGYK